MLPTGLSLMLEYTIVGCS